MPYTSFIFASHSLALYFTRCCRAYTVTHGDAALFMLSVCKYQEFLQGKPFLEDTLSWEEKYPNLSRFLRSWTLEEVEHFERCPHLHPKSPPILMDIFERARVLTELPILYDENTSLAFNTNWYYFYVQIFIKLLNK